MGARGGKPAQRSRYPAPLPPDPVSGRFGDGIRHPERRESSLSGPVSAPAPEAGPKVAEKKLELGLRIRRPPADR